MASLILKGHWSVRIPWAKLGWIPGEIHEDNCIILYNYIYTYNLIYWFYCLFTYLSIFIHSLIHPSIHSFSHSGIYLNIYVYMFIMYMYILFFFLYISGSSYHQVWRGWWRRWVGAERPFRGLVHCETLGWLFKENPEWFMVITITKSWSHSCWKMLFHVFFFC